MFHQQNNDIFMILFMICLSDIFEREFSCFSSWKTVLFCINIFLKISERNFLSVRQLTAKSLLFNCAVTFQSLLPWLFSQRSVMAWLFSHCTVMAWLFSHCSVMSEPNTCKHACMFQAYLFYCSCIPKKLKVPIVTIIEFEQPCHGSAMASLTM